MLVLLLSGPDRQLHGAPEARSRTAEPGHSAAWEGRAQEEGEQKGLLGRTEGHSQVVALMSARL